MQLVKPNTLVSNLHHFFTTLSTKKAILIIVILGFLIYGNMLFNDFVLDDKTYIVLNSQLQSFNIINLFGKNIFNSNITGQYRPLSFIYFAILRNLFGTNQFFYHFFQLIIHIANSVLVFILFKKFLNTRISMFASLIFLVHPIQVEAAVYIAATGDPLFFFFGIIALVLSTKNKINIKELVLMAVLLLFSLLTKETGILFLLVIPLYRIIFKKTQVVKLLIFEFLALLTYLFIRIGTQGFYYATFKVSPIANANFLIRTLSMPSIIFYYIKTFFFPLNLITNQFWIIKHIDFNNFYLPLALDFLFFCVLTLIGKYLIKVNKHAFKVYLFFLLWFLLGLIIHLQIFPLDFTVADRFFYFPILGLLGVLSTFYITVKLSSKNVKIAVIIFFIVLITLIIRTIIRSTNWSDTLTLLIHDSKIQDNFLTEEDIAAEYALAHDFTDALIHYRMSIDMHPYDNNYYEEGLIYELIGDIANSKKYFYKSYEQKYSINSSHQRSLNLYLRLGKILLLYDNPKKARDFLLIAVKDYPDESKLWILLAISDYYLHDQSNSIIAIRKAKVLTSNSQTNYLYNQMMNNQPIQIAP